MLYMLYMFCTETDDERVSGSRYLHRRRSTEGTSDTESPRISTLTTHRNNLGRDRLEIQIRKLNKVSSYLIDHTVSQIR